MQRKSAKLAGRARELTALMRVRRVPGLVTVGGPPGVGKTALARCCAESWGGPSWVVNLTEARCRRDGGAGGAGTDAARSRRVWAHRAGACRKPSVLLVLKNFEHLANSGAALIKHWVKTAPSACLVVTSRAAGCGARGAVARSSAVERCEWGDAVHRARTQRPAWVPLHDDRTQARRAARS